MSYPDNILDYPSAEKETRGANVRRDVTLDSNNILVIIY